MPSALSPRSSSCRKPTVIDGGALATHDIFQSCPHLHTVRRPREHLGEERQAVETLLGRETGDDVVERQDDDAIQNARDEGTQEFQHGPGPHPARQVELETGAGVGRRAGSIEFLFEALQDAARFFFVHDDGPLASGAEAKRLRHGLRSSLVALKKRAARVFFVALAAGCPIQGARGALFLRNLLRSKIHSN